MALPYVQPIQDSTAYDLDLDETAEGLAHAGLIAALFDNTLNTSKVYVKIYLTAFSVVGTDHPIDIIMIPAGSTVFVPFNLMARSSGPGLLLSVACVTTPGTAGTTGPTNSVKAKFLTQNV